MHLFNSAKKKVNELKTHIRHPISRPHTPTPGSDKLDQEFDYLKGSRSLTPTPTTHHAISTDDLPTLLMRRSISDGSSTAETLVGGQSAEFQHINELVHINVIDKENPTFAPPVSSHGIPPAIPSVPAKRRFVQSASAQQDIVVLHVAYILQDSPDLQKLILEIVKLSEEPDLKEIVASCVTFTTQLIAAVDAKVAGVDEAIATFLKYIDLLIC
jgi:hypothetical protein